MLPEILAHTSHSRFNPLTGEWVLISPQRLQRPWQGEDPALLADKLPSYDSGCYLCPGNARADGSTNPVYESVYVFDNDFPALHIESPVIEGGQDALFRYRPEAGRCKVICFDPAHNKTLADLTLEEIGLVIAAWIDVQAELQTKPEIAYVEIFENKGTMMGCSNPHPHGQVWATSHVPRIPASEDASQLEYMREHGRPLLQDYLEMELAAEERVVAHNEDWVVLVPFWAVWPFETLLMPRFQSACLTQLSDSQQEALARIMKDLLRRYDSLFGVSMPYSMGWHSAPCRSGGDSHWLVHAHYYPPLLRSATVRKFLVGFEMLAQPQRDITAEHAARRLREV